MSDTTWRNRQLSTMRGIRGLTDDVTPRPRTIGRLRKGATVKGKTRTGKEFDRPVDLTHFRFTSTDPKIAEIFHAAYGPEPRIINAILPYPTADECFQTCKEEWRAGGLVHRCDGVSMTVWIDDKGVRHVAPPATPQPCPYHGHPELRTAKNPGCLPVGRLAVMIPELMAEGYTGVVVLAEGSKHDLMEIRRNLLDLEQRRIVEGATLRPLYYFPVTLRRVEREVSCPDDEHGHVRRTKWLVEIEPAADWMKLQLNRARAALLPEDAPRLQLQSPDWEDVTTGGRTVGEVEAELFDDPDDAPGFALADDTEEGEIVAEVPAAHGNGNGNGSHWYDDDEKKLAFLEQLTKFEIAAKDALCYLGVTDWHAVPDPRNALNVIWRAHQAAAQEVPL